MNSSVHSIEIGKVSKPSLRSNSEADVATPVPEKRDIQMPTALAEDQTVYPSGMKLFLIILSLYLAMFLVALVSAYFNLPILPPDIRTDKRRIEPSSQPLFLL
jgi:hypothetical protein